MFLHIYLIKYNIKPNGGWVRLEIALNPNLRGVHLDRPFLSLARLLKRNV